MLGKIYRIVYSILAVPVVYYQNDGLFTNKIGRSGQMV